MTVHNIDAYHSTLRFLVREEFIVRIVRVRILWVGVSGVVKSRCIRFFILLIIEFNFILLLLG